MSDWMRGSCLLVLLAIMAQHATARAAGAAEEQRLTELKAEYARERDRFRVQLARAGSASPSKKLAAEIRQQQTAFSQDFLEVARSSTDSDTTFSALAWVLENDFKGSAETQEALELLARDHLENEKLADLCLRLANELPHPNIEKLLIAAAESKNRRVQGNALFSRALFLKNQIEIASRLNQPEGSAKRTQAEQVLGPELSLQIAALPTSKLSLTTERLLLQVSQEYSDVPSFRGTLANVAEAELFEMQHLAVGQIAPEIVGVDLDGKEFKLSDFRGKVVVLSFWGSWCPECMKLLPQERALATSLADRPFALVGVCSDPERLVAKEVADREQITWRSWWDGEPETGPIAEQWNIKTWPTLYVLDHNGKIRHKSSQVTPTGMAVDVAPAVDEVLQEIGDNQSWLATRRNMLLIGAGTLCLLIVIFRRFLNRTPGATHL